MKIRTDYVTNSSSSSFMLVIRIGLKNGEVLKFMGDGGVGEGDEEFYELTVNKSPEALGKCGSIDELIKMLQHSVVQGSDTYYDDDEEPEDLVITDDGAIIEGLKNLKSMDDIETITINGDLFGRGEQHQYKHYTYYRDRRTTVYDEGGDEDIYDEGTGGSIGFYGSRNWKEADDFGNTEVEEYEYYDDDVGFPGEKKKTNKSERKGYFSIKDGVLKKYKGSDQIIVIPKGVIRIASGAFHQAKMTSVVVPEGVKQIEDYAFPNCSNLEELTLPSTIEEFGEESIMGCYDLGTIYAPANVKKLIEDKVECEVIDPDYEKRLKGAAFSGCFDNDSFDDIKSDFFDLFEKKHNNPGVGEDDDIQTFFTGLGMSEPKMEDEQFSWEDEDIDLGSFKISYMDFLRIMGQYENNGSLGYIIDDEGRKNVSYEYGLKFEPSC